MATWEENAQFILSKIQDGTATPSQQEWYKKYLASGSPDSKSGMVDWSTYNTNTGTGDYNYNTIRSPELMNTDFSTLSSYVTPGGTLRDDLTPEQYQQITEGGIGITSNQLPTAGDVIQDAYNFLPSTNITPTVNGMAADGGQFYGDPADPNNTGNFADNGGQIVDGPGVVDPNAGNYDWDALNNYLASQTGVTGDGGAGGGAGDGSGGAGDGAGGDYAYGLSGAQQNLLAGLSGAERAVGQSTVDAMGNIINNYGRADDVLTSGQGNLMPYINSGAAGSQLQAALSGAMGPEAQAEAFANYQASPDQQWRMQQMEEAITRNAAATGGLGGGRVLEALQENAAGLAAQDYNNYFNRLGSLSDRGLQANQLGSNYDLARSGVAQDQGNMLAQLGTSAGNTIGDMRYGAGNTAANYAYDAGLQQSGNIMNASNALANQHWAAAGGLDNMLSQTNSNLANLLTGAGTQDLQAWNNYATMLGNAALGVGSDVAGLPGLGGTSQNPGMLGSIGNLLGGVGSFMGALP